jgi:hypothetical protein
MAVLSGALERWYGGPNILLERIEDQTILE